MSSPRLLGLLVIGCLLAPATLGQGNFSVPAPRTASAAAATARKALDEGDLPAAAAALATLLDLDAGTLIELPEDPGRESTGSSAEPWVGAAVWARQQLDRAPAELGELMASSRESLAVKELQRSTAFEAGRSTAARKRALEGLLQRYPGTRAALEAGLMLGDLAFEAGDPRKARAAWSATANAGRTSAYDDLASALERRLAVELPTEPPPRLPTLPPQLEGSWTFELPFTSREGYIDYSDLYPVAAEGRVFVNSGLRVLALRASNGRLLWDSGEPLGWDALSGWKRREMSRGIGREDLVNAVATDGRVVVAPQQLPYSNSENDQVDGLTITVSLPERRLFAFDAVSGAPLWNHAPDAARRLLGLPLEFQQRARISAPPKIVGDLVLVPSYELVGRINLYVSAYDLFTGELVWSQLVVSGQTRVNLFGEHEVEFNSAPLATTEDAVFVATGLGVVACLDRTTGEPRWTQDYSRFKLPRTNGYYTPRTG
ncbi:MAG: PQQ-binding-like beta-propeller repeat protein, partial [Planctomycetes bacterium]|nr:PQQ-binding-like beta-propeller repeat protein [Planctomycetota bacterium]